METLMTHRRSRKDQEARTTRMLVIAMIIAILAITVTAFALPALAGSASKGSLSIVREDLEGQMKTRAVVTLLVLRLGEGQ
jgi:hypothetical protein